MFFKVWKFEEEMNYREKVRLAKIPILKTCPWIENVNFFTLQPFTVVVVIWGWIINTLRHTSCHLIRINFENTQISLVVCFFII